MNDLPQLVQDAALGLGGLLALLLILVVIFWIRDRS